MKLHDILIVYSGGMHLVIQNPEDDTISSTFSGFQGLYDVEHFIKTLRFDVKIVESIPEIRKNGKVKKIKAFQVQYLTRCHFIQHFKLA